MFLLLDYKRGSFNQAKTLPTTWHRSHTGLETAFPRMEGFCDTVRVGHDTYTEREAQLPDVGQDLHLRPIVFRP